MLVSKKRRNSLIIKQGILHKDSPDSSEILSKQLQNSLGFTELNKMQKESFQDIYMSNDNCVVSAPTGSGKTALCEIAIAKLLFTGNQSRNTVNSKILYIAPTKSLCFEKYETWKKKFSNHNISVGILTGDTESFEVENIKNSNIIVTTPEKWDLLTRRWFDYIKLFDLIKLLLVDEIHILRTKRGSTLEAVITRMKRMCKSLRIIALSATIPNVHDISAWIRKSYCSQLPAKTLIFEEEYRPVKLSRIVFGYKNTCKNIFQFDFVLNAKLVEIIKQKSQNKPVLIFCPTRKLVSGTATYLSKNFVNKGSPNLASSFDDKTLQKLITLGVGYHHAGLSSKDRKLVEKAFIKGEIKILCSTSTLAIGVNLPAYMVIIKGTKSWQENGIEEYSELDILQMIGRAGRPQFETSGCAVILTEDKNKSFYEKLLQGSQKLESCLHKNLLENLAVELSLNTVYDVDSAVDWLSSTFFYTRYCLNPLAYNEVEGLSIEKVDERLASFCEKQLHILQSHNLIEFDVKEQGYKSTKYGHSMSKHYILLETMKLFINSKPQNSLEKIFELLCSSCEFEDLKVKHLEKKLYKQIASSKLVKFIPPKLPDGSLSKLYKVYLLFQFELCGIDFPSYEGSFTLFFNFNNEKHYLFQQAPRLLKCLCDIFSFKHDSISLLNALELLRSVSCRCWKNSPLMLRQVDGLSLKNIKKLINNNVQSIVELKEMSPQKIEQLADLKPGIGKKIIQEINEFPEFLINCNFENYKKSDNEEVFLVKFSVTAMCTNGKMVTYWHNEFVQVNIVVETSDGTLVNFKKIPCCKLFNSITFCLEAKISKRDQFLRVHIFSENLAYSASTCILNLKEIPATLFRQFIKKSHQSNNVIESFSEFDDEDDSELDRMFIELTDTKNTSFNDDAESKNIRKINENIQLQDERKVCKHTCKNKLLCDHFCCKNGILYLSNKKTKRKMPSQEVEKKGEETMLKEYQGLNHPKKGCKKLKENIPQFLYNPAIRNVEDITDKFESVRRKIDLSEQWVRESFLKNTIASKKLPVVLTSTEERDANRNLKVSVPKESKIGEAADSVLERTDDNINIAFTDFSNTSSESDIIEINNGTEHNTINIISKTHDSTLSFSEAPKRMKIWQICLDMQDSANIKRIERADSSADINSSTLGSIEKESSSLSLAVHSFEDSLYSDIVDKEEYSGFCKS